MSGQYHVEDRGLLVAPMKKLLWDPLLRWVPAGASANSMTLVGSALNTIAMTVAVLVPPSRLTAASIAVLVFLYLALDNLDGAQARRTGTSSPLGELLDHWIDGINGTYLSLGAVVAWGIVDARGVVVVAMTAVAYSVTYWEQRTTGRLHFGRLGNLEGISGVALLFAAQAALGPETLSRSKIVYGQSVTDLFASLSIVTCTVTAVTTIARVRRRLADLPLLFFGGAALIVWYLVRDLPFLPVAALFVLLTPAAGGRMLIGRLTGRPDLGPDLLLQAPIAIAAVACTALGASRPVERGVLLALVGYSAVKVGLDGVVAIRRLSRHIRPGELLSFVFGAGGASGRERLSGE